MKYGLVPTAYPVDTTLLEAEFKALGWSRTFGPDWDLLWYVGHDPPRDVLRDLQPTQRMNHFPRLARFVSKAALVDTLAQNGDEDGAGAIHPITFRLPAERESFERHARDNRDHAWIVKPPGGTGGRGIMLYREAGAVPRRRSLLAQRYLDEPMTIDGCKFNLRVYLLITSIDPLVAWIYRDGYADLAGAPFTRDGDAALDPRVFNTNTHVQVALTGRDAGQCSRSLRDWIDARDDAHGDGDMLWRALVRLSAALSSAIGRSLRPALSDYLVHPNNCFELLGLDVQFDRNGKAWLIECNRGPELAALSSKRIKQRLIRDLLRRVLSGRGVPDDGGAAANGFERIETG